MKRLAREDWLDLAVETLKDQGVRGLTLDTLCALAGRTRGSFYHHFVSIEALIAAVVERWRLTETETIASRTLEIPDAREGLALMARLTDAIDHRLERGVRVLAMTSDAARETVELTDQRREAVMVDLLTRAYDLTPEVAGAAARLFHALHHTAVMRSPEDIRGYTRGTIRVVVSWLEAAGHASADTSGN